MKTQNYSEKKKFSIVARAKSMTHAFRGLYILFKTQHNFWIHLTATVLVIVLGFVYKLNEAECGILVLAIIGVLVTEAINTSIEIDMDLTSPDYHPYAKDSKDVAAGAVLLATIGAVIIGLIIFLPKMLAGL